MINLYEDKLNVKKIKLKMTCHPLEEGDPVDNTFFKNK